MPPSRSPISRPAVAALLLGSFVLTLALRPGLAPGDEPPAAGPAAAAPPVVDDTRTAPSASPGDAGPGHEEAEPDIADGPSAGDADDTATGDSAPSADEQAAPSGDPARPSPDERAAARPFPRITPAPALPRALTARDDFARLLRPSPGRLHAVLLNGGGRPEINYQSHLQHIRGVLALLREHGIPSEAITVFSGDGTDPKEDLATRALAERPDLWLVPENAVGQALRPPVVYVDSRIDGVTLRAATKPALRRWFAAEAGELLPGDTLLVYVTDHGDKNEKDLADNTITLWGESVSVAELREMLAALDRRVRVVMVMSQCYAGSFANAIFLDGDGVPSGNVCGYFAATADRWAYGCYPENRGKEGIGYSHHLLEAVEQLGRLPEAHRRVLVTDGTPDVPHTSADFYLDQRVRAAADGTGGEPPLVDALLAEAWQHRGAWEPDIRQLDAIGRTFGSFSPRSLAELEEQSRMLPEFGTRLSTYADRWRDALEALRVENLKAFTEAYPAWKKRLDPRVLKDLDGDVRIRILDELLAALVPFSETDPARLDRLRALKQKAEDAAAASYRSEVRLGVVLRMRALLTSIAGRVYMARYASAAEREGFERLRTCENLTLGSPAGSASAAALPMPEPFPVLAEERRLIETLMPAYMGIHFRPLPETQRKRYEVGGGAVTVLTVSPDSPAATAGLEVGDIILGPPGAAFQEPEQVREWTMRREIGVPADLDVLRDAQPFKVTLRPGPYPLELPKLPGPPQVGSVAPPLKVEVLRGGERTEDGKTRLAEGRPRLLFFWATWCVICKHAVPEVLAFAKERDVDVVAITDEEREIIERFLIDAAEEPFPTIVASDPLRASFQGYGVSGTPTFVLVDPDGKVVHYQTGYPADGLRVEGWTWEGRRRAAADGKAAAAPAPSLASASASPAPPVASPAP